MTLRFLLIGLVIGLGAELPSGDEVASWVHAGSDWVQARIDGTLGAGSVAEAKPATDPEFAAIGDEMANAFAADLALAERPAPSKRLAFEPIEVPNDTEPGLAFALNQVSQGQGREPEPDPSEIATTPAPAPNVAGRLASAVRLTREAAAAWAGVLRGAEATVRVR